MNHSLIPGHACFTVSEESKGFGSRNVKPSISGLGLPRMRDHLMPIPDTADVPGMVLLRPFQPLNFCFCQRDISPSQQTMLPSPRHRPALMCCVQSALPYCHDPAHLLHLVLSPGCLFSEMQIPELSVAISHPSHFNYIKKYIFCMCVCVYSYIYG